jgi:hypothetical protein
VPNFGEEISWIISGFKTEEDNIKMDCSEINYEER